MDKVDKRGYLRSERKEKMTCHTFRSRKLLNESGGKKIKNEINKEPTIFCSYNKRFNMQKRNKKNYSSNTIEQKYSKTNLQNKQIFQPR